MNCDVTLEVFIAVTVTNHRSLYLYKTLCIQLEMHIVKICDHFEMGNKNYVISKKCTFLCKCVKGCWQG